MRANVYNTNTPEKLPVWGDAVLPLVLAGRGLHSFTFQLNLSRF
jgi:hypothetical protein